jgi:lysophospholipase L1-like esterase
LFGSYRIIINKIRELNPVAKIILVTPMQRSDFVYINDKTNNAWGSYKEKNGQSLKQFAEAVKAIARFEQIDIVDLYNNGHLTQQHLVKYKRLKDPATGAYKNYPYPTFATIPFNPATDDYPYPSNAMNATYDGLHPSDKGYAIIAKLFVKIMKRY